jgi:hypothetical protein
MLNIKEFEKVIHKKDAEREEKYRIEKDRREREKKEAEARFTSGVDAWVENVRNTFDEKLSERASFFTEAYFDFKPIEELTGDCHYLRQFPYGDFESMQALVKDIRDLGYYVYAKKCAYYKQHGADYTYDFVVSWSAQKTKADNTGCTTYYTYE